MAGNTITIRTNSKILEDLTKLAEATDRSRNWLIEEALKQYLDSQSWQVEAIQEGVNSLEMGKSIEHSEVVNELGQLLDKFSK